MGSFNQSKVISKKSTRLLDEARATRKGFNLLKTFLSFFRWKEVRGPDYSQRVKIIKSSFIMITSKRKKKNSIRLLFFPGSCNKWIHSLIHNFLGYNSWLHSDPSSILAFFSSPLFEGGIIMVNEGADEWGWDHPPSLLVHSERDRTNVNE